MAKFFRVIFNLLLICYILVAAAIFVPPLVGVTTAVTFENTQGNQTVGTVDYAIRTPISQIVSGDKILVTDIDVVNVYTVTAVDQTTPAISVAEIQDPVNVRTHAQKMLIAVPYIGYLAVLLQNTEGMIILIGAAAALLILCIIFGVICRKKAKRREEEDEYEDEDDQFYRSLAEQKVESDAKAEIDFAAKQASRNDQVDIPNTEPALDEEYEDFHYQDMIPEETELQNAEMTETVEADYAAEQNDLSDEELQEDTGSNEYGTEDVQQNEQNQEYAENQEYTENQEYDLIPEQDGSTSAEAIEEPLEEPADTRSEENVAAEETADNEITTEEELIEETIPEDVETSGKESVVKTGNIPGVQAALEAALSTQQIQHHVRRTTAPVVEPEEESEQIQPEEIELAIPLKTADEYLQKAYADGDDPAVKKDELTGVTFIDYSDCI